jgi:hypothetical protein
MSKERDMSTFAYCTKGVNLESFYDVVVGKKIIENIDEQKNWECGYFAMSMLLPRDKFLDIVRSYGGVDNVLNDDKLITLIADQFMVEDRMVVARLIDLVKRKLIDMDIQDDNPKKDNKRGFFRIRKIKV